MGGLVGSSPQAPPAQVAATDMLLPDHLFPSAQKVSVERCERAWPLLLRNTVTTLRACCAR